MRITICSYPVVELNPDGTAQQLIITQGKYRKNIDAASFADAEAMMRGAAIVDAAEFATATPLHPCAIRHEGKVIAVQVSCIWDGKKGERKPRGFDQWEDKAKFVRNVADATAETPATV